MLTQQTEEVHWSHQQKPRWDKVHHGGKKGFIESKITINPARIHGKIIKADLDITEASWLKNSLYSKFPQKEDWDNHRRVLLPSDPSEVFSRVFVNITNNAVNQQLRSRLIRCWHHIWLKYLDNDTFPSLCAQWTLNQVHTFSFNSGDLNQIHLYTQSAIDWRAVLLWSVVCSLVITGQVKICG